MKQISLDPSGRLVFFRAVPEQIESATRTQSPTEWQALFASAGLDPAQFKPVPSKWVPPTFADSRTAWEGAYPSKEPLRIEAASYHGKPVYFHLIGPWTRPAQMVPVPVTRAQKIGQGIIIAVFVAILLGAIFIARRNVSLGRGDRRGASRLAIAAFLLALLGSVISTTHVPTAYEFAIMVMHLSGALFLAALMWILYLALEPYVRRRWPHALIAFGKVLAGRFRDPLVGRDVLIGSAAGVALAMVWPAIPLLTNLAGGKMSAPQTSNLDMLDGLRFCATSLMENAFSALSVAFIGIFLVFAFRIVLRRDWLAFAAIILIFSVVSALQSDVIPISLLGTVMAWSMLLFVMVRFGLVAMFSLVYVSGAIDSATDFTSWHSYSTWMTLGIIAMMAAGAFYTSLAGRPLLREALLET